MKDKIKKWGREHRSFDAGNIEKKTVMHLRWLIWRRRGVADDLHTETLHAHHGDLIRIFACELCKKVRRGHMRSDFGLT
jgi:hypothetical protein